jgi:hypothetical protein
MNTNLVLLSFSILIFCISVTLIIVFYYYNIIINEKEKSLIYSLILIIGIGSVIYSRRFYKNFKSSRFSKIYASTPFSDIAEEVIYKEIKMKSQ